jgi:hypothetical protein
MMTSSTRSLRGRKNVKRRPLRRVPPRTTPQCSPSWLPLEAVPGCWTNWSFAPYSTLRSLETLFPPLSRRDIGLLVSACWQVSCEPAPMLTFR